MTPEQIRERARRFAESDQEAEVLAQATLDRLAWRSRRGAKRCSRCQETKSPFAFGQDGTRRDGLDRYCRECRANMRRQD